MNPIRFENDIAVFSSDQIDLYGPPDLFGFERFMVIESREAVLVTDYKMEHSYDLIPIHRYNRLSRFKSTLLKIIGEKTKIPDLVYNTCKDQITEHENLWEKTRIILKKNKWTKYYDCIPAILHKLGYWPLLKISADKIECILNDFRLLQQKFDQTKHLYRRRYFPNIRFVVLKLLEFHDCLHDQKIPFVRTPRKLLSLSLLWEDLINQE